MVAALRIAPDDDPILAAVERAPLGEPFTPEQRAELDHDMIDIAEGRVQLVDHDAVPGWLEVRDGRLGRIE